MIAAWYIQWNQLADVAQNFADGVEGQVERIKLVKNQVEKAKAISKHIILMGDINIDMSEDVDQELISRTTQTLPIYQEIMEENGLVILNKDKTRYAKNEKPSLIDHITTNMVNQIDNISTDKQPISDHCMVTFNLHSSEQIEAAKFLFTQDWSQATKNLWTLAPNTNPN